MKNNNKNSEKINNRVLLFISVVASFFNPMMGASVNVALPNIAKEFNLSAVSLSWIAMSFLLASAIGLLPFGKIADNYGRKKIFQLGNVIIIIASIFCAIAINGNMLIIFRAIQGLGSAMIFGTTMAIVTSAFPLKQRGKIIGINVTAVYLGLSIAPLIGGFLTQTIGWRSLFYLMSVVSILTFIPMHLFVKTEWKADKKDKFDFIGSFIYGIAITGLIYGFSKLPDLKAIIITTIGVLGLILFVIYESKLNEPVLNINLFKKNKSFAFSNLAAMINYAATFSISFILSLYLQYVKGFPPQKAGIILISQPLVMALCASFSGRLSDKIKPKILASIGMAVVVIGLCLLIFVEQTTNLNYIIACLIVVGIGFGIFSSPNTNAIMSAVEGRYLGIASATVSTMRVTGQMLSMGIASLVIHIFIGEAKINTNNLEQFGFAAKIIFIIFTLLCIFGVFSSLIGINQKK